MRTSGFIRVVVDKVLAAPCYSKTRFRWGRRPNAGEPKLTESGLQFVKSLAEKYGGSEFDWRTVGWEAWYQRRAEEREDPEADWRAVGWEVWHKRWAREQEP